MQNVINELAERVKADLAGVTSKETLASFWQEYLSKNGKVPALMKGLKNVSVVGFDDLLISFAHQIGADVVVKGLRAITDFEYEFQMTAANYQMDPSLETMFIMSPPHYMYLSSSIVREIASFGGDVAGIVPPCVDAALKNKLS